MRVRGVFFLVILLLVVALIAKPTGLWQEFKRAWSRREWTLRILATIAVLYFLYGLYTMFLVE